MPLRYETAGRVGQLRHRIKVEHVTSYPVEHEGTPATWETFADRFAKIKPISGQEGTTADQVVAVLRYEIVMRYVEGITPEMRIVHGSRVYHIDHVYDVDERNRWTVALCTERHDRDVPAPQPPDPSDGTYGDAYGDAYG